MVFTSKQEKTQDRDSRLLFGPSTPGQKVAAGLPYYVDIVAAARITKDQEGNVSHWLQCRGDGQYLAKDRSGCLETFEEPNLAQIKKKILGLHQSTAKKAA